MSSTPLTPLTPLLAQRFRRRRIDVDVDGADVRRERASVLQRRHHRAPLGRSICPAGSPVLHRWARLRLLQPCTTAPRKKFIKPVSGRLALMRSVAILLCVSLFGLNAEAAMLHVHEGGPDGDHDHHGAAAHAHKIHVEVPPVHSEMKESDDDCSAVPVVLGKATTSHIFCLLAVSLSVVSVEAPPSSHVPQFVVTSRAHGPPGLRSSSLRAPPRSHLL